MTEPLKQFYVYRILRERVEECFVSIPAVTPGEGKALAMMMAGVGLDDSFWSPHHGAVEVDHVPEPVDDIASEAVPFTTTEMHELEAQAIDMGLSCAIESRNYAKIEKWADRQQQVNDPVLEEPS